MHRTKHQHYVPRFHLKDFSADGTYLYAFDKTTKAVFSANIKDIAGEHRFYDLPSIPDTDTQAVETVFSAFETYYSQAVRDLIAEAETGKITTGPTDRNRYIAHFLLMQFCRTLNFREILGSAMQTMTDLWVEQYNKSASEPITSPQMEMSPLLHAQIMFGGSMLRDVYPLLFDYIWIIGDSQTNQPFYTSDAPVIRHGENGLTPDQAAGFGSLGVEIYLPLSSRYILLIFDDRWFSPIFAKLETGDGDVWQLKPEEVDYYNSYQVNDSRRQVYCRDDAFDVARKMVDEAPEIGDLSPSRFNRFTPD
jgi:hypothetical protein